VRDGERPQHGHERVQEQLASLDFMTPLHCS